MTKKITVMFLLLALVAGLYVTAGAKGDRVAVDPKRTAQVVPTATTAKPGRCEVYTGIDGGTVNLRRCAGTACAVLDIVTEGESVTILTAGNWANVTTEDGVTGWLNNSYCKKEK